MLGCSVFAFAVLGILGGTWLWLGVWGMGGGFVKGLEQNYLESNYAITAPPVISMTAPVTHEALSDARKVVA